MDILPNHLLIYMYAVVFTRRFSEVFPTVNMCKTATLKRPKTGFQDQLSLNAGQKYSRMLQREQSAIFSTVIKLPFVIKIFVLPIFEWPFYTGFTVYAHWKKWSRLLVAMFSTGQRMINLPIIS